MFTPKLTGGALARNPHLVKFIIVHCSATPPSMNVGADEIRKWHLARGFKDIGYHYVIRRDGTVDEGRPLGSPGAHCKSLNNCSVGICYVGGVAEDGVTPDDTRTSRQEKALREVLLALLRLFPDAEVHGHRDFAAKACPSFDATREYKGLKKMLPLLAVGLTFTAVFSSCRSKSAALEHLQAAEKEEVAVYADVGTANWHCDSFEVVLQEPAVRVRLPDSTSVEITAKTALVTRKASGKDVKELMVRKESQRSNRHDFKNERTKQPSVSATGLLLRVLPLLILVPFTIYFIKKKYYEYNL